MELLYVLVFKFKSIMKSVRLLLFLLYIGCLGFIFFYEGTNDSSSTNCPKEKRKPLVPLIVAFAFVHILAGVAIFAIKNPKPLTVLMQVAILSLYMLSITAGYHRLYTHQSYQTRSVLLDWFYAIAGLTGFNYSIYDWVKTHKVHHRYSDTCLDPHNINESFFHSHMNWILLEDPAIESAKRTIAPEVAYLLENPVVMFQHKHKSLLQALIMATLFGLPLLWGDGWNGFWLSCLRIIIGSHSVWSVNSVAHTFGYKPYDPDIKPSQNIAVSMATGGEGYHNYHHTYPRDYRAASNNDDWNPTTWFLDSMYHLGVVRNLKYSAEEGATCANVEFVNNKQYCLK
jgi:stearoyl-CoA desaturase (Delta-9 desaturase)